MNNGLNIVELSGPGHGAQKILTDFYSTNIYLRVDLQHIVYSHVRGVLGHCLPGDSGKRCRCYLATTLRA